MLRKNLGEFIPRTLIQPLLLVFVFLYVFPQIGEGIGGGGGLAGESRFAAILVAGVVGLSIMFQGIQAVALPLATEFGYTKEIEDRVLAPLPVALVAIGKIAAGAIQGIIAAAIVFPIAFAIHAPGVQVNLNVNWPVFHPSSSNRHYDFQPGPGAGDHHPAPQYRGHVRIYHLADDLSGRHLLSLDIPVSLTD